jgi:hypothetical protein
MGTRANVVSGVTAYGKSTPADNGGGAGIYATERFTAGNLGIGLLSQWGMGRIYGRKDAGTLGIYEIKRGNMSRMRPCTRYVSFG